MNCEICPYSSACALGHIKDCVIESETRLFNLKRKTMKNRETWEKVWAIVKYIVAILFGAAGSQALF